jgi:starch-binding outer membrane protein, SusD/RagB family
MIQNFKKLILLTTIIATITSCTKLDETPESEIVNPTTPAELAAVAGPSLAYMRDFAWSWLNTNTTSTDECLVPIRGGDWTDGNNWKNMHLHTWDKTHAHLDDLWGDGFVGVGQCNRIIETFEALPVSAARDQTLAEVKVSRAIYYYLMLDNFGNVPLVSGFSTANPNPPTVPRAQIYAFIESEVLAAMPKLSVDVTQATYGKPTQWVAKALLAKLYMNAQVYTGTAQWAKADAVINDIIVGAKFSLTGDYQSIFKPDNGPQIKEIIFAIPFDANKATGINRNGMVMQQKTLHYPSGQKYGLPADPWNGFCTMATFYNSYGAGDRRSAQWEVGPQFRADGAPLLDGTLGQVNYDKNLNYSNYDQVAASGAYLGRSAGARNIKYFPDPKSNGGNQNNDLVFFRYADILLYKSELFARGYTSPNVTSASSLAAFNDVRTRAGIATFASAPTTVQVYDERGREFAWEGWRRQDMIRFGTWESAFGFNAGGAAATRRLFPIPNNRIASNPNLTQNPGY